MSDLPAPLPSRRFNESDTDAILRRAAELASGAEGTPTQRGLTIEEMEALAGEAGLDPALVQRAAREVGLKQGQRASPWAGAPLRVMIERQCEGELSEEIWESMVGEIQRTLGGVGFASRVGRTRTWTVSEVGSRNRAGRVVSITATVQHGRTVLRADETLTHLAGAMFGGIVGGVGGGGTGVWIGIGMGLLHSPVAAAGMVLTAVAGAYGLARLLYRRTVRKRTEELSDLLQRLTEARPLDG
jgi:hypothetical protein